MVNTIKFSEFKTSDLSLSGNQVVGLKSGENVISDVQLGESASKDVTDDAETKVASVQGSFTTGHILIAADSDGTIKDGGNPVGTGTVTQVNSGTGLTGGPINGSGTLSFISISANSFWANTTGGAAVPSVTPLNIFMRGINNLSEITNRNDAFINLGFGSGTSISIADGDFTAGVYQLPTPCPNFIVCEITTPGLQLRLPIANLDDSPVLTAGPVIQSFGSTEDLDIGNQSGVSLHTVSNNSRVLMSLNNNSTANGTWIVRPITITVNGESGIVTLSSDNLEANDVFTPINYTPTSSTITGNLEGIDNALSVSGVYSPTVTNVSNATDIVALSGMYSSPNISVGSIVTCSVTFTFKAVSNAVPTIVNVSVPLGADFSGTEQASGSGFLFVEGAEAIGDGAVYSINTTAAQTGVDISMLQATDSVDYRCQLTFQYVLN